MLDEVDPVAGIVITSHFVAKRQASDADVDAGTSDSVSQSRKPFVIGFGLLDLDDALMFPMGNICVKLGSEQLVSLNPRSHKNDFPSSRMNSRWVQMQFGWSRV